MKKFFLLTLAVLFATASFAARQSGLHKYRSDSRDFISFGMGPNYMFGDMGGSKGKDMKVTEWDILYTRPTFQIFYEHDFNKRIGARLNFVYSLFAGNDEGSRNSKREYEYYTHSFETSLNFVFYFYQGRWGRSSFDIYAYTGVGYNMYNANWYCVVNGQHAKNRNAIMGKHPDAELKGVSSTPNKDGYFTYDGTTMTVPIGMGVRFPVSPYVEVSADFGWRWAFGGDDADFMDGMKSYWSGSHDTYAVLTFSAMVNMELIKGWLGLGSNCYAKYGRGQYRNRNRR